MTTCNHDFAPQRNAAIPPSQWLWLCRTCGASMQRTPAVSTISATDLNAMVDSSLRCADEAELDDQSVKGEKWIWRLSRWRFGLIRFEIAYHLLDEVSFVLYFDAIHPDGKRVPIPDTATYGRLIGRRQ